MASHGHPVTGRVRTSSPKSSALALSVLSEGCATFPAAGYNPDTLRVLLRVYDEAWIDIRGMLGATPVDATALRAALARRIMAAANSGERDPKRSKLLAVRAIDA